MVPELFQDFAELDDPTREIVLITREDAVVYATEDSYASGSERYDPYLVDTTTFLADCEDSTTGLGVGSRPSRYFIFQKHSQSLQPV